MDPTKIKVIFRRVEFDEVNDACGIYYAYMIDQPAFIGLGFTVHEAVAELIFNWNLYYKPPSDPMLRVQDIWLYKEEVIMIDPEQAEVPEEADTESPEWTPKEIIDREG